MAGNWSRLDAGYFRHPKVAAMGKDGRALDLAGICWATQNETNGHIPRAALALIAHEADVKTRVVSIVVAAGRWHENGDGWDIHDYLDFNRSADEIRKERNRWQRNKARQRASTPDPSADMSPVDNYEDTDDLSAVDISEESPPLSPALSPPLRNVTERSDLHLLNNSHPRVPADEDDKRKTAIDRYVQIQWDQANQKAIRNKQAFLNEHRRTAEAHPELDRWLHEYPEATGTELGGWLNGDKQTMRYHARCIS
jgi:hypothetical protein